MLDRHGVVCDEVDKAKLDICGDCSTDLAKHKIPRFALANGLYRGELPDIFTDLTWVEEKICAIYCTTAHITRLFQSSDPSQPKVFHGNTCAHDMNIVSTASVLPRTPADVTGLLSMIFVGPGKFNPKQLGTVFRVRKAKIWAFLLWLKHHNRLYANVPLNPDIIQLYPNNDIIPGLADRVVEDHELDAKRVFHEETAGFEDHPATLVHQDNDVPSSDDDSSPVTFVEKMGVSDPDSVKISGRAFTASALRNLIPHSSSGPDLIIHRGSQAINEYNNPDLFPGMYPTLFPYGIGGFEDKKRLTPLSFQQQAQYLLNVPDRSFRYHQSFLFVVLNIHQRHLAHLYMAFTCKKSNFNRIAERLTSILPEILNQVAFHLEQEHKLSEMSHEEKNALSLLQHVNTISARIPGSEASKIYIRNEIRSYYGYFSLPHLFFTFNPSVAHSPIFQVMFGDHTVDLSERFPRLVSARERAIRLAQDPVATADFFQFSVQCCFKYLLGWDFKKQQLSPEGGLFGRLQAFYGTTEYTERGSLHGHFLLWLKGAANPAETHHRLHDEDFQKRFFAFFEDIIQHHLPDIETPIDPKFEPRIERPPKPPSSNSAPDVELKEWESIFVTDVKKCGEALQRHQCRPVCHKYGNEGKCRFLFPHEIIEASYFDLETNSVVLMCRDGNVNYHNQYILVFCRHNHDLKCILSGKSAKAAMFYISDYITKMGVKTYEMLSLLSRTVARLPSDPNENSSTVQSAKILLHKCLSQFNRQQQIHAQQAARYIQGYDDSISSHSSVPMLSSLLLSHVKGALSASGNHGTYVDGLDLDDNDSNGIEVRISTDKEGKLVEANQIHHYLYRADTLVNMNFYDFCRCVRLQTKTRSKHTKHTHETRLGVLKRHGLKPAHPLHATHELVEHVDDLRGDMNRVLVPRVIGTSIPRSNNKQAWMLFTLSHFKPFNCDVPLIQENEDTEEVFDSYQFSDYSRSIMLNWEAIHECEDERDADQLRKQAQHMSNRHPAQPDSRPIVDDTFDLACQNHTNKSRRSQEDFRVQQMLLLLQQAGWLKHTDHSVAPCIKEASQAKKTVRDEVLALLGITKERLALWKKEIASQELSIATAR